MFKFLKKNKESTKGSDQKGTGLISSLFNGLKLTRKNLASGIKGIFSGKTSLDPETLEQLEAILLTADVGVKVTQEIISQLKAELKNHKEITPELAIEIIKNQLVNILEPCSHPLIISNEAKPFVILLVGINGSGKTTTIGKLAKKFQNDNHKVILAAGDTFRAAAIDQLKIWGERNNISVISQKPGADSAAVIFDALQAAKAREMDLLIADTAGRLHTHDGFMQELKKVKRTISKLDPDAPHEVLIVLDATIGQNAINQVKQFNEIIGVTGICITKLDGSAKGGAILAIAKETKIPIRFIGVGEGIEDLKEFNAKNFVDALFGNEHDT